MGITWGLGILEVFGIVENHVEKKMETGAVPQKDLRMMLVFVQG